VAKLIVYTDQTLNKLNYLKTLMLPISLNKHLLNLNELKIMKAIWNNQIIAESNETILLEGNHYFPEDSIKKEFFDPAETQTFCPYKGQASYYSVNVNGKNNPDAAWYYPTTKKGFENIAGYIAFWRGVEVTE
jgi:Uncharacterized protein conserved in bacteria